jgi:hypothetical protein
LEAAIGIEPMNKGFAVRRSCRFRRCDPFDAFVFFASSVMGIPEINVLL